MSAPAKKHSAPAVVPAFAIAALTGSDVEGSTSAATAEMPKKTEPSRFRAAIRHAADGPRSAPQARQLETRKQIEPKTSGVHTRRSAWRASNPRFMPSNVLTLKNRVPTNWISEASLSARVTDARSCTNAAVVKKIEPTKNVTPSPGRGAEAHCETNEATAKQDAPIANSTPIHQSASPGRHQSRSPRSAPASGVI